MSLSLLEKSKSFLANINFVFGVVPKFQSLTRKGKNREALALMLAHCPKGALVLPWSVEIIHKHGLLQEYSAVIGMFDRGDFGIDALNRQVSHDEKYLITFAKWWSIVARDKMGLESASLTALQPYFDEVDLHKVSWTMKKRFPMKVHPNWA